MRSLRSTGSAASTGAGSFQPRPGLVMTRTGAPKRVMMSACPASTVTAVVASTAAPTTRLATAARTRNRARAAGVSRPAGP